MIHSTRSTPRCSNKIRFGIRREQWTADSLHILEYAEPSPDYSLQRDHDWCDQCDQRTKKGKHIGRERSEPEHPSDHPVVFWALRHPLHRLATSSTPHIDRGAGWPETQTNAFDRMLKHVYSHERLLPPPTDRPRDTFRTLEIIDCYTGLSERLNQIGREPYPMLAWLKEEVR